MFVYALCDGYVNIYRGNYNIIAVYSTEEKAEEARKTMAEKWKYGRAVYTAITNPNFFEVQKIKVE